MQMHDFVQHFRYT